MTGILTRNILTLGGIIVLVAVAVMTAAGWILPDDRDTIIAVIMSLLAGLGIGGGAINLKK